MRIRNITRHIPVYIIAIGLLLPMATGGCASVALRAGAAIEADISKQRVWTDQYESIVRDQIDDYRLEIRSLSKDSFQQAMEMRVSLLEFMEEYRPKLIAQRLLERFKAIKKEVDRE